MKVCLPQYVLLRCPACDVRARALILRACDANTRHTCYLHTAAVTYCSNRERMCSPCRLCREFSESRRIQAHVSCCSLEIRRLLPTSAHHRTFDRTQRQVAPEGSLVKLSEVLHISLIRCLSLLVRWLSSTPRVLRLRSLPSPTVSIITRTLALLFASWQHVVYNQVDPSFRNSYTRPAHMDDKTWKKVS